MQGTASRLAAALALCGLGAACFNSGQPGASIINGPGAGVLQVLRMEWGRLVDVVDLSGAVVERDALVRADLAPDGIRYGLRRNPATEQEELQVLAAQGTPAFASLLAAARAGLPKVEPKGPDDPPGFTMVPRNAALRLVFSEELDPGSVTPDSVQLLRRDTGEPLAVRTLVRNDRRAGRGTLVLDPTISARQSATLGLPGNAVGLPASYDGIDASLELRLPTRVDPLFGQPVVLRNRAKSRALSVGARDPVGVSSGGHPVVLRALRAGNEADAFRGFLRDVRPPALLAEQAITATEITAPLGPASPEREIEYSIDLERCEELAPEAGDVHLFLDAVLLVTQVLDAADPQRLRVRASLLEDTLAPGSGLALGGRLLTRYDAADAALQTCFLQFTPAPPERPGPIELDPHASVRVRFDEPVDLASVQSLHSFVVTAYEMDDTWGAELTHFRHPAVSTSESVAEYVDRMRGFHLALSAGGTRPDSEFGGRVLCGPVEPDGSHTSFTLAPIGGWSEPNPNAQPASDFLQFAVALRDGADGIHDLAGNPIAFSGFVAGSPAAGVPPEQHLGVAGGGGPSAARKSRYLSLRAFGIDENGDGLAEYGGQFDVAPGRLLGRPFGRFPRQADASNFYVGQQNAVPFQGRTPPYEPLTPTGSVLMTLWRPHDLGFGYRNAAEYDLDVAALSLSPMGGVVFDDVFPRFSLALAHAASHPDELQTQTGAAAWPNSGLVTSSFAENVLGAPEVEEQRVFDTAYRLRQVQVYPASGGQSYLPLPEFSDTYTWRDTTIPPDATGGRTQSLGAPPSTFQGDAPVGFWPPGQVPSIASPLLARFRTWPRGDFLGSNRFQVQQMVPVSPLPAFRIFSAGGRDQGDTWHRVTPDDGGTGTIPSGGFDLQGLRTPNADNVLYWADVDFVVRVSRVFTHWFDLGTALRADDVLGVTLEPADTLQPRGTGLLVEYRGSVLVDHGGDPLSAPSPLTDAGSDFDAFGEHTGTGVSTPSAWTSDLASLEGRGYRYLQIRISFLADADSGRAPSLDALGLVVRP